jgi:hypothetical protein
MPFIVVPERVVLFTLLWYNTGYKSPYVVDVEEYILRGAEDNPCTSVCQIQAAEHVVCMTWWILHKQLLYVCHLHWIQAISLVDFHPHQEF